MIIETPCTTNFMAFTFNQSIDYKNSFMIRCLMDVNYKVVKPKNPIIFAHTTSLLTTQRWNLSIWLNINLSPPEKLTIFVTTLALGSWPRQGHGKMRTKKISIIVPSSPKPILVFNNPNGFYWLFKITSTMDSNVCICWINNSKVFYNCSFSQSSIVLVFRGSFFRCNTNLGFWLLVSTTKTILIVISSFFGSTWETLF